MSSSTTSARRAQLTARNGLFATYASSGIFIASWMTRVPDVKQTMALTPSQLSFLLLAVSVGALLGLSAGGWLAHRHGAAFTLRLGVVLSSPALVLAAFAIHFEAPLVRVWLALWVVGLGTGISDVALNLEGTDVERALGRSLMPRFHAAFSAGSVAASAVGAGLVWLHLPMELHLSITSGLAMSIAWLGSRGFLPVHPAAGPTDGSSRIQTVGRTASWREPRTLLLGLTALAAAFAEGSASNWIPLAFVEGHQQEQSVGVAALAVFLAFMTTGRVAGTHALDRFGRVAVVRALFVTGTVGCLLVVFGHGPIPFLGAALWGLGTSLGFPVSMSAAADDPSRAALRISTVSTIGYSAFLAGPPLIGFAADRVGTLAALLIVAAAMLLATFASSSTARSKASADGR